MGVGFCGTPASDECNGLGSVPALDQMPALCPALGGQKPKEQSAHRRELERVGHLGLLLFSGGETANNSAE